MSELAIPEQYEQKALGEMAIRAIVREAVLETIGSLGFDAAQPTELQADMYYLRRLRRGGDEVRSILRHSLLTVCASAMLYLIWHALKAQLAGKGASAW